MSKEAEAKDFIQYLSEARDQFVQAINKQQWNTELRTEAENILIAYDQMREKINQSPSPQEVTDEVHFKVVEQKLQKFFTAFPNNSYSHEQLGTQTVKYIWDALKLRPQSPQAVTISYEFLEWIVVDDDLTIMPTTDDRKWIWFSSTDGRINGITTEQLYDIYLRSKLNK